MAFLDEKYEQFWLHLVKKNLDLNMVKKVIKECYNQLQNGDEVYKFVIDNSPLFDTIFYYMQNFKTEPEDQYKSYYDETRVLASMCFKQYCRVADVKEKLLRFGRAAIAAASLRGKSYFDESWERLLDQIDFNNDTVISQLCDLLFYGAYITAQFDAIQKVKTNDFDGPQGISSFMTGGLDACAYCSEVVVASTFNVDLVRKYGEAIGQEGLTHGIVGWYGPAMNTHRTPFSGRNFEYYSEDGVLAGKIAASVVSGAADQGFYAFIKHFALNDQETNRMDGICTWATEQAVREIYLKPFEIVVKEARGKVYYTADEQGTKDYKVMRGSTAVMTSFNNVGTQMASACAPLLTKVLRDEWGFQGEVITDFGPYVNYDNMIRSGNDYLLNATSSNKVELTAVFEDTTSPTAKSVMRRCIKNMCYTVVNSAAFDGVAPGSTTYRDTAPWRYLLAGVTAGFATIAGGLLIWNGIAFVLARKKAKEEPELAE